MSACDLRRGYPDLGLIEPADDDTIYSGLREPTTEEEVNALLSTQDGKCNIYFTELLLYEGILGRAHPITASSIYHVIDELLYSGSLLKCNELWQRAVDFKDAAVMSYSLVDSAACCLLFTAYGFSAMAECKYIPYVLPHFQWGLKELAVTREFKSNIVSCVFRMIAAWIKVADCIKDPEKQAKQTEMITKGAQDLIKVMENNPCPLLIACLQNIPQRTKDIEKVKLYLYTKQSPSFSILAAQFTLRTSRGISPFT